MLELRFVSNTYDYLKFFIFDDSPKIEAAENKISAKAD